MLTETEKRLIVLMERVEKHIGKEAGRNSLIEFIEKAVDEQIKFESQEPPQVCEDCNGTGWIDWGTDGVTCQNCAGTGSV